MSKRKERTRLVVFFDFETNDLSSAYKQLCDGLSNASLDWESADEWFDKDGVKGDPNELREAREKARLYSRIAELEAEVEAIKDNHHAELTNEIIKFSKLNALLQDDIHKAEKKARDLRQQLKEEKAKSQRS